MSQTPTGLSDHERKLGVGHTGRSRGHPDEKRARAHQDKVDA
jgi:hypothetical protein